MKIVQSYWSKPNLASKSENKSMGGWSDSVFFYMSWALSCLTFKEFYDHIELVTDENGKKLLVEMLELPYDPVKTSLEDIKGYDHDLWAVGKIYAYSIQTEPFIHADYDVYIWNRFPDRIENSELIGQHLEISYDHNQSFYQDVENNLSYIPESILNFREKTTKEIIEVNAGILGGFNLKFFKEYTAEAFHFVDKNYDRIGRLTYKGMFNTIFEQYLFYCLAQEKQIPIEYLIKEQISSRFEGLADFTDIHYKTSYIHTVGDYKKYFRIGEQVAYRLWHHYPQYYNKIIQLYQEGILL
ncbi:MAG: hypothetical protein FWF54_07675 [Candidatus Azobacteroides sp.]|nr:hypothetical protein [Candidatus Azobacteroides sp.]